MSSSIQLKNPCKYSFRDLYKSYFFRTAQELSPEEFNNFIDNFMVNFNKFTLEERNTSIKITCEEIGWYYKDIITPGGKIFTSFSPEKL